MLSAVETTNRGFEIVEFTDRYGVACSLQQSSLATDEDDQMSESAGVNAVWLGCNDAAPQVMTADGWKPVPMPEGYIANTRMHLTRRQVEGLVEHLQSWLETGSF